MNWPDEDSHAEAIRPHFDRLYYLTANPDVRASGIDPLRHYLRHGWREGRDPSRSFDTTYYLRTNLDVAAAGMNPLLHYVWSGRDEGRPAVRPMHAERSVLAQAAAPSRRAAGWAGAADHSAELPVPLLRERLRAGAGGRRLVLSVSHDDCEIYLGGVQNVVREERQSFMGAGWGYLHLSPAAPLPVLAKTGAPSTHRVALRLGLEKLGIVSIAGLLAVLEELAAETWQFRLVVHHLLGHAPETIAQLAKLAPERTVAWAHDFFTLCTNPTLMRNDVRFCHAPPVASSACRICVYGEDRREQAPRIAAFFEAVRPVLLAPSAAALTKWQESAGLPVRQAAVQPLARLAMAPQVLPPGPFSAHWRIGHCGARAVHKGWNVFERLALQFADDPRYEFYHLGVTHGVPAVGHIRHVVVEVDREHPDAMIEAVAEHRLDAVILWSNWPETFCYAAHEAVAAGAVVLTHRGTGNVAQGVAAALPDQCYVLEDEAALHDLLASGSFAAMMHGASRRRGTLLPEGGTFAWMAGQGWLGTAAPDGVMAVPVAEDCEHV